MKCDINNNEKCIKCAQEKMENLPKHMKLNVVNCKISVNIKNKVTLF